MKKKVEEKEKEGTTKKGHVNSQVFRYRFALVAPKARGWWQMHEYILRAAGSEDAQAMHPTVEPYLQCKPAQ